MKGKNKKWEVTLTKEEEDGINEIIAKHPNYKGLTTEQAFHKLLKEQLGVWEKEIEAQ